MEADEDRPDAAIAKMLTNRDWAAERTKRFLIRCFEDLVREFSLRAKLLELGRQHMGKNYKEGD